jgi:hypothetical protein
MTTRLRTIAEPFVVARPSGARVRTRLAAGPDDEAVLLALGAHLGSVMGRDLAQRCREGALDARGRVASRARRKRAATKDSQVTQDRSGPPAGQCPLLLSAQER